MPEIVHEMRFPVELDRGLLPKPQKEILKVGDANANRVVAVITDNEKPHNIDGVTVVGAFIRPQDGARVDLEGKAEGNEASVLLTEKCYELSGMYTLDVILVLGEVRRTILTITGEVEQHGSGDVVISGVVDNIEAKVELVRAALLEMQGLANNQIQAIEEAGAREIEAIKQVGADHLIDELNATADAQKVAIAQKGAQTLETIPETYADLDAEVKSLKDTKANVITDTSPKAASHELHAQDGRLAVTLYGQTTETGSGEKSPDNPYTIHGVDEAEVKASGKNLLCLTGRTEGQAGAYANTTLRNYETDKYYVGVTRNNYSNKPSMSEWTIFEGGITVNGNSGGYGVGFPVRLLPGVTYTVSFNGDGIDHVGYYDKNGKIIGHQDGANIKQFTPPNGTDIAVVVLTNRTAGTAVTFTNVQLEVGTTATAYEPYNANIITPALLPDGAPLMGNGTAMDTIENDVLSGCDKRIVLTGAASEDWVMWYSSATYRAYKLKSAPANLEADASGIRHIRTSRFPAVTAAKGYNGGGSCCAISDDGFVGIGFKVADYPAIENNVDSLRAYLSANPLTVYYRSTDYTPDKDLRVCKVVRNWKTLELTGNEALWTYSSGGYSGFAIRDVLPESMKRIAGYSSDYAVKTGETFEDSENIAWIGVNDKMVYVLHKNNPFASTAEFKAHAAERYAAGNPITFTYKLTTPEVYMTDPITLRNPSGIMPVTVTGSGETAVTYPRDTKDWGKAAASSMIGATESGMVATTNYSIGAFIIDRDSLTLYRATKAIAKGEAITPGTNCVATTVVEQLANLYTMLNA